MNWIKRLACISLRWGFQDLMMPFCSPKKIIGPQHQVVNTNTLKIQNFVSNFSFFQNGNEKSKISK